ncbi:MAG: hypothetical protein H6709_09505 [Kofleriaceae bacterium]|nr:hypothetical protein [Kofleriaceae bacterium]
MAGPSPELDARLARIAGRLALLAASDRELKVFGAAGHRWQLEPPLDAGELAAVEAALGAALPAEVAAFLTRIGRAGAGPYYGFVTPAPPDPAAWAGDQEVAPRPAAPFPFDAEAALEVAPATGGSRYDGTVLLAHQGCGYVSLLIVGGPRAGEVWADFAAAEGPLAPEAPSFLTWYEGWLDDALLEWARDALPAIAAARAAGGPTVAAMEAVAPLLDARAEAPSADLRRSLGYLRCYQGRFDDAEAAFDRAAEVGTQEPEARRRLDRARLRAAAGRYADALDEVAAGLATPGLWYATRDALLGERQAALFAQGHRAEALATMDLRAEQTFFDVALHHALAREHLADGDVDAAAAVLARAFRLGIGVPRPTEVEARRRAAYDGLVAALEAEAAAPRPPSWRAAASRPRRRRGPRADARRRGVRDRDRRARRRLRRAAAVAVRRRRRRPARSAPPAPTPATGAASPSSSSATTPGARTSTTPAPCAARCTLTPWSAGGARRRAGSRARTVATSS